MAEEAASIDGRVMRGARNRAYIMDAIFELVQEGELSPTAEQVARRAGVGTRTVFRHYDDMESLFAEMSARLEREIRPIIEGPRIEGSLEERVRALIARRGRIFERIAPFRRSARLQRRRSKLLAEGPAEFDRVMRAQLLHVLASELRTLPDEEVEALDMLTSFEAWERLRQAQGLSRERAQTVMDAAVRKALAG